MVLFKVLPKSIHDIPWIYFRKIKLNYLFSTRLRGRLGAKASLGFVASTIEIPSQSFPTKSDIDNFHPQKKRTDVTWKCRSGEYWQDGQKFRKYPGYSYFKLIDWPNLIVSTCNCNITSKGIIWYLKKKSIFF